MKQQTDVRNNAALLLSLCHFIFYTRKLHRKLIIADLLRSFQKNPSTRFLMKQFPGRNSSFERRNNSALPPSLYVTLYKFVNRGKYGKSTITKLSIIRISLRIPLRSFHKILPISFHSSKSLKIILPTSRFSMKRALNEIHLSNEGT